MPAPGSTPIIIYNSSTASQVPLAANLSQGELAINVTDKKLYTKDSGGNVILIASNGGDVTGPATATDNAIARFDATTGRLIQNSVVTIADTTGNMAGVGTLTATTVNAALNGTLGATTPSTVAATTISASGVSTFSAGSAGAPAITTTGDTNTGIFFPAADTTAFSEGGVEAVRIDASGNVGIGTSSPSTKLDVYNATNADQYWRTSAISLYAQVNNTNGTALFGTLSNHPLVFWTNSAERMRLDSSGNVLIGTTSALGQLSLGGYGSIAGTTGNGTGYLTHQYLSSGYDGLSLASNFIQGTSGGTVTASNMSTAQIFLANRVGADSYITFGTGGVNTAPAERMRLDSSGNLGLGVTPSAWAADTLGIQGPNQFSFAAKGVVNLTGNAYQNAGWKYATTAAATLYQQYLGSHTWYTTPSGTAGNAITWTQAMSLDTSGNLGIGVTPSAWGTANYKVLQVPAGTLSSYSTFALGLHQNSYDTAGGSFKYVTTGFASRYNQEGGVHAWYTAPSGTAGNAITFTQAMTLDASGNLLVGTTTAIDTGSTFVSTDTGTAFSAYRQTTTAAFGVIATYSNIGGASTIRSFLRADGGLANYSANNVNLSDERLKKDISLADNYLAKICAIPVKNFRYNDQSETEDITLGVIAQEVEAIAPELVSNNGFGETPEDGIPLKSIYQTDLQYALMKCIQEQQAMIDELKAKVAALEAA
jgi:hypothetical protein